MIHLFIHIVNKVFILEAINLIVVHMKHKQYFKKYLAF